MYTYLKNESGGRPNQIRASLDPPVKIVRPFGLDIDYRVLFDRHSADLIFERLEREIIYLSGDFARAKVGGTFYPIPRKQAAYGDRGISYSFSGVTLTPEPWTELLRKLKEVIYVTTQHRFNFVLINRYENGRDTIGFHRDNEPDILPNSPIVSLSFGAPRNFIFRHVRRMEEPLEIVLESGSALTLNPPTNVLWEHSLPRDYKVRDCRINLTFRQIKNYRLN